MYFTDIQVHRSVNSEYFVSMYVEDTLFCFGKTNIKQTVYESIYMLSGFKILCEGLFLVNV